MMIAGKFFMSWQKVRSAAFSAFRVGGLCAAAAAVRSSSGGLLLVKVICLQERPAFAWLSFASLLEKL